MAADNLSPAELVEMDKNKLLGIVTRKGSSTSHAAILAKNMDIPCITGVKIPQSEEEWEESIAIIDGYTGTLYLEPDGEVRKEYEIRRKADLVEREELLKLKDEKDITLDGHEMGIYANIGSLDDLNSALYYGARGIGLLPKRIPVSWQGQLSRRRRAFPGIQKKRPRQWGTGWWSSEPQILVQTSRPLILKPGGDESPYGKPGNPFLSGPGKSVQNPDTCHLPCKLVWKSRDDVSHDLLRRGDGGY